MRSRSEGPLLNRTPGMVHRQFTDRVNPLLALFARWLKFSCTNLSSARVDALAGLRAKILSGSSRLYWP